MTEAILEEEVDFNARQITKNIYTRDIGPDNVVECTLLGQRIHEESAFNTQDYDVRKVVEWALACFNHKDQFFFRAVIDRGTVIGILVAGLETEFFGNDKVVRDFVFCVDKDLRGTIAAKHLYDDLEEWSKKVGATGIYLGQTTQIDQDKTSKFYERLGMHHRGSIFYKEIR